MFSLVALKLKMFGPHCVNKFVFITLSGRLIELLLPLAFSHITHRFQWHRQSHKTLIPIGK